MVMRGLTPDYGDSLSRQASGVRGSMVAETPVSLPQAVSGAPVLSPQMVAGADQMVSQAQQAAGMSQGQGSMPGQAQVLPQTEAERRGATGLARFALERARVGSGDVRSLSDVDRVDRAQYEQERKGKWKLGPVAYPKLPGVKDPIERRPQDYLDARLDRWDSLASLAGLTASEREAFRESVKFQLSSAEVDDKTFMDQVDALLDPEEQPLAEVAAANTAQGVLPGQQQEAPLTAGGYTAQEQMAIQAFMSQAMAPYLSDMRSQGMSDTAAAYEWQMNMMPYQAAYQARDDMAGQLAQAQQQLQAQQLSGGGDLDALLSSGLTG